MAQGNHNKKSAKQKSGGSIKRKQVKSIKKKRKGSSNIEKNRHIIATTKAINSKNERIVAAKACNNGTQFFLKDITAKGMEIYAHINVYVSMYVNIKCDLSVFCFLYYM